MEIKNFLDSNDPLCDEAIDFLLNYKEEDLYVDYKEAFSPKNEKDWLGLTADAMAFANTMGGYIVFGVTDETFSLVGLEKGPLKSLGNTSLVLQKLNRYIRPPFAHIRTKKVSRDSLHFVVWYIPESKGQTHVVVKEGKVKYESGTVKTILRPGMIFSRRSGTNQIVEPEDLEFILNRRIDYFKESILDKISKVVEAPSEHQVLVYDPGSVSEDGRTFSISSSPDALPVKGMSFTISPRSDIEELSGWIAFLGRDHAFQPRTERLWHLYALRSRLRPSESQTEHLMRFSLLGEVPVFYWLRRMEAKRIKELLLSSLKDAQSIAIKANILHVGAFIGKPFYKTLLGRLKAQHLSPRSRQFPTEGPRALFSHHIIETAKRMKRSKDDRKFRKELAEELTTLAAAFSRGDRDPLKFNRARSLDCFVYARDDLYKQGQNQK